MKKQWAYSFQATMLSSPAAWEAVAQMAKDILDAVTDAWIDLQVSTLSSRKKVY